MRSKKAAEVALEASAEMIKSVEAQDAVIHDLHKIAEDTRSMAKASLVDAAQARDMASTAFSDAGHAVDIVRDVAHRIDRLENAGVWGRVKWILTGQYPL